MTCVFCKRLYPDTLAECLICSGGEGDCTHLFSNAAVQGCFVVGSPSWRCTRPRRWPSGNQSRGAGVEGANLRNHR